MEPGPDVSRAHSAPGTSGVRPLVLGFRPPSPWAGCDTWAHSRQRGRGREWHKSLKAGSHLGAPGRSVPAEESLSGTHWPVLQLGKQASRWSSFPEVPPRAARAGVFFQPRHLCGHLGGGQCAPSCSWSWQEGLYPCPPNSAVRPEPGLAAVSELGPSPGGL